MNEIETNGITVRICNMCHTLSVKPCPEEFESFREKMFEYYGELPYEVLEYIYYQHLDLRLHLATKSVEQLNSGILDKLQGKENI